MRFTGQLLKPVGGKHFLFTRPFPQAFTGGLGFEEGSWGTSEVKLEGPQRQHLQACPE